MLKKVILAGLLVWMSIGQLLGGVDVSANSLTPDVDKAVRRIIRNQSESDAFISKVEEVASRINARSSDLISIMIFETGGSLSPGQAGFGSSAVGLMQFIESTANGLGIPKCRYSSISSLSRVEQMDCVEKLLIQYRINSMDLASIYAAVNYPARRNAAMNACWYDRNTTITLRNGGSVKPYEKNPALTKYAEISGDTGTLCVTKNSALKSIAATNKSYGISTNGLSLEPAIGTTFERDAPLVFEFDFEPRILTDEEIDFYLGKLTKLENKITTQAFNSTAALPTSLFGACTIPVTNETTLGITSYEQLVGCFKQILTYIFIVAVFVIIINLASSNLGTIVSSGENGSDPIGDARNKIEKGIIGLVLIGTPFLLLDLFGSTFSNFAIRQLPPVREFGGGLTLISALPEPQNNSIDFSFLLAEGRDSNNPSANDGPRTRVTDKVRSGNNESGSLKPKNCNPENCKVLDVPYVNQSYNSNGQPKPYGWNACGAASAVMIGAYMQPDLYDNSTGKNNKESLSLRDNIFYASDYLDSKATFSTCEYSEDNLPIDGVYTISASNSRTGKFGRTCYLSNNTTVARYLKIYKLNQKLITGNGSYGNAEAVYRGIKNAIDNNQPVQIGFVNSGYTSGHYSVIKGYYKDDIYNYVVNDPYGNLSAVAGHFPGNYGNGVIFDIRDINPGFDLISYEKI